MKKEYKVNVQKYFNTYWTSVLFRSSFRRLKPIIYFISLLLIIAISTSAQEICDNGIDDDADGLIDLWDVDDCLCGLLQTNTVVGDFEDFSCCPASFTSYPETGAYCIDDGWQITNQAITGYFNTCDYVGGIVIPFVPMPFP